MRTKAMYCSWTSPLAGMTPRSWSRGRASRGACSHQTRFSKKRILSCQSCTVLILLITTKVSHQLKKSQVRDRHASPWFLILFILERTTIARKTQFTSVKPILENPSLKSLSTFKRAVSLSSSKARSLSEDRVEFLKLGQNKTSKLDSTRPVSTPRFNDELNECDELELSGDESKLDSPNLGRFSIVS